MRRVLFRGAYFDPRTVHMLREVERLTKRRVRVAQGSWSGAQASSGTHAGPGAVDLRVQHLTPQQEDELTIAMRRVGFAFWIRPTVKGLWGRHGHGIACGCPGLPAAAARQVEAYRKGYDGLAGEGGKRPDPQAGIGGITPTTWEAYRASLKPQAGVATVTYPRGTEVRNDAARTARSVAHRDPGARIWYRGTRRVDGETWLRTVGGNWVLSKRTSRGA